MTRPINLYALSRIREEETFNVVDRHQAGKRSLPKTKFHEMESLRRLVDELLRWMVTVEEMDGFFFGFVIPQIGKEFDLLKLSDKACMNIELKSTAIPQEEIRDQLRKNKHYLGHLGRRLSLFTVVTDTMTCYKLSLDGELLTLPFGEVAAAVRRCSSQYTSDIDRLFRASDYLVAPFRKPERFIQGEYFLTQAQELIKKRLLRRMDEGSGGVWFHITGKPGTGKTLLLYDIARTLARNGRTMILHCGAICEGQRTISERIRHLTICPVSRLGEERALSTYNYLLVDEAHRLQEAEFEQICRTARENELVCIFSTDPEQVLTVAEKTRDVVGKIRALPLSEEFLLSEKIRTNRELQSFLLSVKDLRHHPKTAMDYACVELNYANTTQEAQNLLAYYRRRHYTFINYAHCDYVESPYSEYEESFDAADVIGQEYDDVVVLLDRSFYYDERGRLRGVPHPDPDVLYPNLFYQSITRVREHLALIVVDAPELFRKIASIVRE